MPHLGHVRVLRAVIRKERGYCERAKLIDLMQLTSSPHATKRETDSRRKAKAGYYDAILSGKNGHGLWNLSTVEQFEATKKTWKFNF